MLRSVVIASKMHCYGNMILVYDDLHSFNNGAMNVILYWHFPFSLLVGMLPKHEKMLQETMANKTTAATTQEHCSGTEKSAL